MWTDFDKCHNLSKRNVNLILKVLSDLEPLRGSSNKKTLYSTGSCVNSSNKLLLWHPYRNNDYYLIIRIQFYAISKNSDKQNLL
jgi:hypothetical protein